MQQSFSFNTHKPQETHLKKNSLIKHSVKSKKLLIRATREKTGMYPAADGNGKDEITMVEYQWQDNEPFPQCQWLIEDSQLSQSQFYF